MRAYGLSAADATSRLDLLAAANALGNKLEADEPTRYAGLRVDLPAGKVFVRLVGASTELLARYTSDPAFIAEKANVPLRALRNKQEAIIRSLKGSGDFCVSLDVPQGRVRAVVRDASGGRSRLASAGLITPEVDIEEAPSCFRPTATVIGGPKLNGKTWTSTDGTATVADSASLGFVVTNGTSRGILTAAHFDECKFSVTVSGCIKNSVATDSSTGAPLTWVNQQLGNDLDYEWRSSSGNTFTNKINYPGAASPMAITQTLDVRSYQAGTVRVCKTGWKTGYTCGTVANPNEYITNTTYGLAGYFARVHADPNYAAMADGGDSGGPVFGSATAYGIVNGVISGGPYLGDMTFMHIQKISGLSLSVLKVP